MPFRRWVPWSAKAKPEPATASRSVEETSTSPPFATPITLAADVDRDAADLALEDLRLPHVDARSDLDPELPDLVRDRAGASDRVRRTIEAREEAVAGRIELPPPEALQLSTNDRVVPADEIAPPPVTELGRDLRGADDVREQDGDEDARGLACETWAGVCARWPDRASAPGRRSPRPSRIGSWRRTSSRSTSSPRSTCRRSATPSTRRRARSPSGSTSRAPARRSPSSPTRSRWPPAPRTV